MTINVLGRASAETHFEPNHSLRLIIRWMASMDRSDWFIANSVGRSMHEQFCFLQRTLGKTNTSSASVALILKRGEVGALNQRNISF